MDYKLNNAQQLVTKFSGTDPPGLTFQKGGFLDHKEEGEYLCISCNQFLYDFTDKIQNDCGWPSFKGSNDLSSDLQDLKLKQIKTNAKNKFEILCKVCSSHIGHAFLRNTGKFKERHCVNSSSIVFKNYNGQLLYPSQNGDISQKSEIKFQSK